MEVVNLNPWTYSGMMADQVVELTRLMFHEYLGVKNLLFFPEPADALAWLALRIPLAKRVRLPKPRLKLSLLLKDYVTAVPSEVKRYSDRPLVAVFGPGKGEELVPLTASGLSVVCLDTHDSHIIEELLRATFLAEARAHAHRLHSLRCRCHGGRGDTQRAIW